MGGIEKKKWVIIIFVQEHFSLIQEVYTLTDSTECAAERKHFLFYIKTACVEVLVPFSCSAASLSSGNLELTILWLRISLCSWEQAQTCYFLKHPNKTQLNVEKLHNDSVVQSAEWMLYLSKFGQFLYAAWLGLQVLVQWGLEHTISGFIWENLVNCWWETGGSSSWVNAADGIPGDRPHQRREGTDCFDLRCAGSLLSRGSGYRLGHPRSWGQVWVSTWNFICFTDGLRTPRPGEVTVFLLNGKARC